MADEALKQQVNHIARTIEAGGDAMEYLEDSLEIEYYVGSDKQYRGARVLVAFGGPNIWIDTKFKRVEGHWWGDSYSATFTDEMGLDDTLSELFNC